MNSTADIIEQCRYLPGVTVHESGAFTDILLASAEGSGKMRFFRPVFGITPALVSVAAPSWPAPQLSDSAPEARGPLIVNYCLRGRCELVLNDNRSVFLTAGHVSLTEKFACGEYVYPGRSYEGIELFIDTEAAQDGVELLREHFSVDISALRERYCPGGETFIAKMPLQDTLIGRLRGGTDMGNAAEETARRTAVIDLLALLQYGSDAPRADRLTYFTRPSFQRTLRGSIRRGSLPSAFRSARAASKIIFAACTGRVSCNTPRIAGCSMRQSCSHPRRFLSLRSRAGSGTGIRASSPRLSAKSSAFPRASIEGHIN